MTKTVRLLSWTALLLATLVACSVAGPDTGQGAANANTPGGTGRTVVPGSNSTVAGDAAATDLQQKWPIERGR